MRIAALLLLACFPWTPLAAQNDGGTQHRLSIVLQLGTSVGGPAAGLARQLRRAGFDDTSPAGCLLFFCSESTAHPTEDGPGVATGLTARLAVSRAVAVGVGYGDTSLGGAHGYRSNGSFGDYVFSHWEATMIWAEADWRPHPAYRLGGGPGWYRLTSLPEEIELTRLGLVLTAGAEVPADSRFFLDLAVRVHLVPPADVRHGGMEPVTLRPNWTHAQLVAGLGLRL